MSFRFNFNIDEGCENKHDSTEVEEVKALKKLKETFLQGTASSGYDVNSWRTRSRTRYDGSSDVEEARVAPAGQVTIDWEGIKQGPECSEWDAQAVYICDGVVIECIKGQTVEEELSTETKNSLSQVLQTSSDLKGGVYEGGLKVWECSLDLTEYLAIQGPELKGLNVLELGCGAGVPGIFSLQQSAQHVCFQDYNQEVLEMMTAKNVFLNAADKCSLSSYYYGDWAKVMQLFEEKSPCDDKFDIILTSETIYNPESYKSLVQLLKSALKPDGVVYLAAKTCYFGVGGSLRAFEKFLQDKTFDFKVCHKVEEGVRREILELKFSS